MGVVRPPDEEEGLLFVLQLGGEDDICRSARYTHTRAKWLKGVRASGWAGSRREGSSLKGRVCVCEQCNGPLGAWSTKREREESHRRAVHRHIPQQMA